MRKYITLRKHASPNVLKILTPNSENFRIKKSDIFFHISAQNIDCGYSLHRLWVDCGYSLYRLWVLVRTA